jgi:hypothetical protein
MKLHKADQYAKERQMLEEQRALPPEQRNPWANMVIEALDKQAQLKDEIEKKKQSKS